MRIELSFFFIVKKFQPVKQNKKITAYGQGMELPTGK